MIKTQVILLQCFICFVTFYIIYSVSQLINLCVNVTMAVTMNLHIVNVPCYCIDV